MLSRLLNNPLVPATIFMLLVMLAMIIDAREKQEKKDLADDILKLIDKKVPVWTQKQ